MHLPDMLRNIFVEEYIHSSISDGPPIAIPFRVPSGWYELACVHACLLVDLICMVTKSF